MSFREVILSFYIFELFWSLNRISFVKSSTILLRSESVISKVILSFIEIIFS